jgi:hypothetical protein
MYKFILRQRWWVKAAALLLLAGGAWGWLRAGKPTGAGTTFTARRGDLDISVLEGGSVEALESQDFKCEVRGFDGLKILKIVEEGYQVTEDDVKSRKPLVELDSAELKKQLTTQEIQFESTVASLTEARQAYDIQLNQNLSDIKAAEQKARFARLDFDKFMGGDLAHKILRQLGMEEDPSPPRRPPTFWPLHPVRPMTARRRFLTRSQPRASPSTLPPTPLPNGLATARRNRKSASSRMT